MIRIVTAFNRRTATVVVPSLQRMLVHRAPRAAALSDAAATVFAAATLWKHRHIVVTDSAPGSCGAPANL
jgi:hypothetical protein